MLFLVRALDSIIRAVFTPSVKSDTQGVDRANQKYLIERRRTLSARIDAVAFWASSAR